MKIIKETCTKGVNIYLGNEKRRYINECLTILYKYGFNEIQIPILQDANLFKDKVGEENNNLMYNFTDRGNRNLCLAPEYTSVIINLKDTFKYQKDVKLFYVAECFRAENNQAGRWRQFTQLGVEVLNPTEKTKRTLMLLLNELLEVFPGEFLLKNDVTRGLDYYKEGKGFEVICEDLGSSKQVCGGGEYEGGIGFAIGIDRILFTKLNKQS